MDSPCLYKIGLRKFAQAHLDSVELAFLDSVNGALISACTAGNAGISVDFVLAVAFSNGADGALVSTSTAGNTSISNDVSHDITSKYFYIRYINVKSILTLISENAIPFFGELNKKTGCWRKFFR